MMELAKMISLRLEKRRYIKVNQIPPVNQKETELKNSIINE